VSRKYTKAENIAAAAQFNSATDFRNHAKGHYLSAYRQGHLSEITARWPVLRTTYSDEDIISMASGFQFLRDFRATHPNAYNQSTTRPGLLDRAFGHMSPPDLVRISDAKIKAAAIQCSNRSEFEGRFLSEYNASRMRGKAFHDEACAHMIAVRRSLSDDEIAAIAKQYDTKIEWLRADNASYRVAMNRGIFEVCTAHMDPAPFGFDYAAPASFYVAIASSPVAGIAIKPGISNHGFSVRYRDEKATISLIYQWRFPTGRTAHAAEKSVLTKCVDLAWDGPPVLSGAGNTELLKHEVLEQVIAIASEFATQNGGVLDAT
jgi:hypothetical protein